MTYESIQPLLEWIKLHPTWAGIIVFFISLSESLAIVGLLVPGLVLMTAIGAMMGGGILPFWQTLLWAILGAVAGDGISYWLGYHFHQHLRDFWPFKQFPKLLARGESFFKLHGGKSIIFGRFVGPVRPMIPVIAGMLDMKPLRFLFFNIASAIVWAPIYCLPGILVGASLGTLSKEVASHLVLILLVTLLTLWLIYILLLKIGGWIGQIISKSIQRSWRALKTSHRLPWLHKMLATAQGTEEGQLGTALFFLIMVLGFWITLSNVEHAQGLSLWNEPVYQFFRALYSDPIVDWVTRFTGLGAPNLVLPAAFVVGLVWVWKKYRIPALCWLGTIGLAGLTWIFFRYYVAMPRPDGLITATREYSFPSGHTFVATLIYGLAAAYIQDTLEKSHRWIPWAIVLPLIVLISFSRIYLGVHWTTDVIGGLFLGAAFAALGVFVFRRFVTHLPSMQSMLVPGLIVLVLGFSFYQIKLYPEKRQELVRHWSSQQLMMQEWWSGTGNTAGLYRSGAFKHIATFFDIQWLGPLETIEKTLEAQGWQKLPLVNFKSSLAMLSDTPMAAHIPILPKFHRDRLPVLVLTKTMRSAPSDSQTRLVIQLWNSDFISGRGVPLWVGTLREEELVRPLSLISYFQEASTEAPLLQDFTFYLKNMPKTQYKLIPLLGTQTQKVLLINTEI